MRRVRRSTAVWPAGVSTTFNAVRERSAVKVARCVLRGPRFREEAWLPSFGKFGLIRRQAVAEPVCCRSPVVRL